MKKILIIEDEPGISEALTYAITAEGFASIVSTTLQEARDIIEREYISLVLLDIGLPDGSGLDFLKEMRQQSALPMILLTAKSSEIDKIIGLECGADDYVAKPFSPREVVSRIKAVLRRSEGSMKITPMSTPVAFKIDDTKHVITFQGNPLELSRYEYRLLEALLKRPGWVLSREMLMNLCWESPDSSMERTVDTHIKVIRGKLRAFDPNKEFIKTHRGIGYSLVEA